MAKITMRLVLEWDMREFDLDDPDDVNRLEMWLEQDAIHNHRQIIAECFLQSDLCHDDFILKRLKFVANIEKKEQCQRAAFV